MYNSSKWQLLLLLQLPETFSKLIFVLFPPSKYLLSVSTFCSTTFMAIFLRRKIKRIKLSWMAYLIVVDNIINIHSYYYFKRIERVQMIFVFMKLLSFLRSRVCVFNTIGIFNTFEIFVKLKYWYWIHSFHSDQYPIRFILIFCVFLRFI